MTSTGKRWRCASYWSATLRTRPMSTPSRSIPAPGVRPRTDWSKTIRTGTATPSARRERRAAIGEEREDGVLRRLRRACRVRRRVEGHAAGEHRGERLRVDAQAARVQRQVDAARVPEAAVQGDELLVRRLDEDLHRQLVALGVERVADDAADRRAAMEHRRADVERAEVLGAQHEDRAGLAAQHERRRLEADELAARLGRDAGVGADVGAREAACRGR